jgi:hypothetical protein
MHRYTASEFRQNLSRALNEVEKGEPVVVERKGRRFRLAVEEEPRRYMKPKPFFELSDLSLLETGWTWELRSGGMKLRQHKLASRTHQ